MEVAFNCEVLTPLFLGGADARLKPELRAPSVRGALRYWFRALVGGSNLVLSGNKDELHNLKREEERVFGSTDRASSVVVAILPQARMSIEKFQKDRAIRTPTGDFLPVGKDYLLWSMSASGRPEDPTRYQPAREYIRPGSRFQIKLKERFGQKELTKAIASFWLLANLGALGARANRGAGSFQALARGESVFELPVPAFKTCHSIEELETYLTKGIRQCLTAVGNGSTTWRKFNSLPSYDILSADTAEIWIVANNKGGWPSYVEALNGIGEKLRDYRNHQNRLGQQDHDAVLMWLKEGGRGPVIRRAVFGLPIPFRYSEGGPRDVIQSTISSRRASPLKIRVTRLGTGSYVGVLTVFKSRFLKEGEKLQLQTRKWAAPVPENYAVIQDFIQTFPVRRSVDYA